MAEVRFKYQEIKKGVKESASDVLFEIDAFLVEKYSFSNQMTNLPVEEGSNITDHVSEEPDTLSIEAFIGQSKFEVYAGEIPDDLSTLQIPDPKTRIRRAYQELLRLKRERQPVDVVAGLDTFTGMIISSLEISRDVESGADLPFSMSFQKIKTVKSEETTINASALSASSAKDQAGATTNAGQTGKQEAPKEDFYERRAYEDWKRTNGKYPTSKEFKEMYGETPEQFAARWGG
jgi:hypothetical protein